MDDVASDLEVASPNLDVVVDRNTAYRLGVNMSDVDNALQNAFGQAQIQTIYSPTYQSKVILEVEPRFLSRPENLSEVFLQSSTGGAVPLSEVAHFVTQAEPLTVNHQGLFPAVTLSFNVASGAALSQAVSAINAAPCQGGRAGYDPRRFSGYGPGLSAVADQRRRC